MKNLKSIFLLFITLLLLKGSLSAQPQQGRDMIMYNGIKLPHEWPPRYAEPAIASPMPVPYLDSKPDVIPVNVGRQLFVDPFLISETDMTSVYHKPNFFKGNPVLEPSEEWEKTILGAPFAAPFSDGIWYDETDDTYKMWYLAGAGILKDENKNLYTCYAESKDGKKWIKVNNDVYPNTNIVDTFNRDAATIWLDKFEKDPVKRYKMFNVESRPSDRRWQYILKYSIDGIHWSNGIAQSGDIHDRSTAFYNPFRGIWCLSMRSPTSVSFRSRTYLENADPEVAVSMAHRIRQGIPDKNVVYWITPDGKEPHNPKFPEVNPGIYNFDAIAYESIMLGQYTVWQGPENEVCAELGIQKKNEIFLGYSRDGFHFSRPSHEPFMAVNEIKGAWNWGNVQSINGTPLIVGDSLYFYCSGRKLNDISYDSYTSTGASTGLATLRRDGFVSMNASKTESYLLTEKLSFDGKYLFVNAEIRESLYIEVLDENGNPIDGFTKKESTILKKTNSTKQIVTWKNNKDLSALAGKIIRLKFYVTDGDLYAFWISLWHSGESRGYTSGGGPNLSPSGVDIPLQ
jgi:hypothetical protein